ncbi:hypothetical protein ACFL6C_05095, partial [Myxococcota bacterium]
MLNPRVLRPNKKIRLKDLEHRFEPLEKCCGIYRHLPTYLAAALCSSRNHDVGIHSRWASFSVGT